MFIIVGIIVAWIVITVYVAHTHATNPAACRQMVQQARSHHGHHHMHHMHHHHGGHSGNGSHRRRR